MTWQEQNADPGGLRFFQSSSKLRMRLNIRSDFCNSFHLDCKSEYGAVSV